MSNPSRKQVGNYLVHLDENIGEGSFGKVYKGEHKLTNERIAIKVISKQKFGDSEWIDIIHNEIIVMKKMNSDYVVKLLDFMQTRNNIYIMQELCDSNLRQFLKSMKAENKTHLSEVKCIQFLTQICKGFIPLIEQDIAHRDLKPDNILMKNGACKLADFGFSKSLENNEFTYKSQAGTPKYMPLEILKGDRYTNKCDIWCLGLIFYELLHGFLPWNARETHKLINQLSNTKELPIIRKDLSPQTIHFLKATIAIKQQDRISWAQLCEHPIFKGSVSEVKESSFQIKLNYLLKIIMIGIKNLSSSLTVLLQSQHLETLNYQLPFDAFFSVLSKINPSFLEQDAKFLFRVAAKKNPKRVSLEELKELLKLPFKIFQNAPQINSIFECFKRLGSIMVQNDLSLENIFEIADQTGRGDLILEDFENMLLQLNPNVSRQLIVETFNAAIKDRDRNQMYLEQFENCYRKITSTPESCSLITVESNFFNLPNSNILSLPNERIVFNQLKHQNHLPLSSSPSLM